MQARESAARLCNRAYGTMFAYLLSPLGHHGRSLTCAARLRLGVKIVSRSGLRAEKRPLAGKLPDGPWEPETPS
jgi:hypothetical protein